MEEIIGKFWHRYITRLASSDYPQAAIRLQEIQGTLAILFRAFGGDPGLRLASAVERRHGARRKLLARVAGTDEKVAQGYMDESTLRLPREIAIFSQAPLNRDLYLWLVALAAAAIRTPAQEDAWLRNQEATSLALTLWPGLAPRYRRLVEAHIAQRIPEERLPPPERPQEAAIRHALRRPGSATPIPPAPTPPAPVPLWLWGFEENSGAAGVGRQAAPGEESPQRPAAPVGDDRQAHAAKNIEHQQEKNGLLLHFRAESLLSLGEFIKVNRPDEEDPDPHAEGAARDLDYLSIAPDGQRVASRIRFDLDLPSAAEDDQVLGEGIPLPEWDYRKEKLREDFVRLLEMAPRNAGPAPLPPHLAKLARRLHHQFLLLSSARRWLKAQADGPELDLDATVRAITDKACGNTPSDNLYLSLERRDRDLACLVLADLSLSTDAWVSSQARVVDVIRDTLLVFGEALTATGDRFALCGFSSLKRSHVRFSRLKDFDRPFDAAVRGRVLGIKPGYYTRLGAGIRHASNQLVKQAAKQRLLLILSDGKPNDLDLYEGRYGVEDTRRAVLEAKKMGLQPFCVTIDREGQSYLPHLFGPKGYAVIHRPEDLPKELPQLYAQLTR